MTHLIAGLGNPGKEYEYTRHNLGFLVVRHLGDIFHFRFKTCSFTKGLIAEGQWDGHQVCLLMPLSYMNNSGTVIKSLMQHKNVAMDDLLVVCDDLSLDFGQMRLRCRGSDAGHNGLASIIHHLETREFNRLRLGIGHPGKKEDVVDFVLNKFGEKEKERLGDFISKASDSCCTWIKNGISKAMEMFNRRMENGKE